MIVDRLGSLLATSRTVIADGATTTHIQALARARGAEIPAAQELLNLRSPELVREHHRGYLRAGSDILLTNSYGANRFALSDALGKPVTADQVTELNHAAAQLLVEEIAQLNPGALAAGSVGPTGWIVGEPDATGTPTEGEISYDDAVNAYEEQISGLVAGGVDAIWFETHSSPIGARAAIDAWRRVRAAAGRPVPYLISMVFNKFERTQFQYDLHDFATDFGTGVDGPAAFGLNCGQGPAVTLEQVARNPECWTGRAPLIVKANAGPPLADGPVFNPHALQPAQFGRYAQLAVDYGARIVGICCGSTPEHIAAIRKALTGYSPGSPLRPELIESEIDKAKGR